MKMEGQEINNSVVGPMGRNIDDVELITRVLLSQKPWLDDPCTLRLPWRHDETDEVHRLASRRQLTFAVLRNDGLVVPHPPVTRVLDTIVDRLKLMGYDESIIEPSMFAS